MQVCFAETYWPEVPAADRMPINAAVGLKRPVLRFGFPELFGEYNQQKERDCKAGWIYQPFSVLTLMG